MPITYKRCGVCRIQTSQSNPMGKHGICVECHRGNAHFQGYSARSQAGPGTNKHPGLRDFQIFSDYWLEYMEGWMTCSSTYRRGPWGHNTNRTPQMEAAQSQYEQQYGYARELGSHVPKLTKEEKPRMRGQRS